MNTPGLDLAIDLRKGPGSYDSITETISAIPNCNLKRRTHAKTR